MNGVCERETKHNRAMKAIYYSIQAFRKSRHISPPDVTQGGSSFANHLRSLLVVAHGEEGAMTQVPGIRPFEESDLADQFRFDPAALRHFLCG